MKDRYRTMSTTTEKLLRLIRGEWNRFRKSRADTDEELLRDPETVANFLLSRRGEASGTMLAQRLFEDFESAPPAAQLAFFEHLARNFGPDGDALQRAIDAWRAAPGDAAALALHNAAEPRRQELIRRLNYSSGGTYRLVEMREKLLTLKREHPELAPVDADFRHLFTSWFNPGFLEMRPIDWRTPANILEKLIRYEAVHTIRDWDDLRRRLDPPDRRCFGFFHPQLVDEPLIFVEVALTNGPAHSIQALLDSGRTPTPADTATTAVFYSISNTQKGLAGVPFGSFLLKHAIDWLRRDVPTLTTFVTLSPVPGFARWLAAERANADSPFIDGATRGALEGLDAPDWPHDAERADVLREPLLHAAAVYFLQAKTPKNQPLDPVARFHLRNGAALHRMHFLGDTSPKGMKQAHGLMVNYLYVPDDLEKNHEAFAEHDEVVASAEIKARLANTENGKKRRVKVKH
jgi:malonyl-CoA decarboxylase